MGRRRNVELRALIRRIVESGEAVEPIEVWRALRERGYSYKRSYIRFLLWDMKRKGELECKTIYERVHQLLVDAYDALESAYVAVSSLDREAAEKIGEAMERIAKAKKLLAAHGGR